MSCQNDSSRISTIIARNRALERERLGFAGIINACGDCESCPPDSVGGGGSSPTDGITQEELDAAIAAEAALRLAADTGESFSRSAADTAESAARLAADTAEANTRAAADTVLTTNLTTEVNLQQILHNGFQTESLLAGGVDFYPVWDRPSPFHTFISQDPTRTYYQAGMEKIGGRLVVLATVSLTPDGASNNGDLIMMESTDLGATWSPEWHPLALPSPIGLTVPRWLQGHLSESDGKIWMTAQAGFDPYLPTARWQMYLLSTTDIRGTWTVEQTWIGTNVGNDPVPGGPMVSTGKAWLVPYYTGEADDIGVKRSTDYGATWTNIPISKVGTAFYWAEPKIYKRPGGKLVMWVRHGADLPDTLYHCESIDDGATWSALEIATMPVGFHGNGPWGVYTPRGDFVFLCRSNKGSEYGERLFIAPPDSLVFVDYTTPRRLYNSYGSGLVLMDDGSGAYMVSSVNTESENPAKLWNLCFDIVRWGSPQIPMIEGNYRTLGLGNIALQLDPTLALSGIERSGKAISLTAMPIAGSNESIGFRPVLEFTSITSGATVGSASDWKFLHDGTTDYMIAASVWIPADFAPGDFLHVINTSDSNLANVGANLYAKGGSKEWDFYINNGSGTDSIFVQGLGLVLGAWNRIIIGVDAGSTIVFWTDVLGVNAALNPPQDISGYAESAANPTTTLRLGNIPGVDPPDVGSKISDLVIVKATPSAVMVRRLWAYISRKN